MNKEGAIIIIEDDKDDQLLFAEAFKELNYSNEIIFFGDGEPALEFLTKGNIHPFIILSDINLPKLNGIELRNKLRSNAALNLKCIPYLFFTTVKNHKAVVDAYSASAQGFFTKPNSYEELKEHIKVIMEYWLRCSSPSNFLF